MQELYIVVAKSDPLACCCGCWWFLVQDVESKAAAKVIDDGKIMRVLKAITGLKMGRHEVTFIIMLVLQSFCIMPGGWVLRVRVCQRRDWAHGFGKDATGRAVRTGDGWGCIICDE